MKIYRDNIKMYNGKLLNLSKLLKRISLLRLFIFVISSIIIIYLVRFKLFTSILAVLPILSICFSAAIQYYNKIAFLKKHTTFLKGINEAEISKEECNLEEFDTGHNFANPNHPYTSDLDIFGQHSIFQLVNRTTTESGKILLSEWLSEAAPNNEIHDRQEAIKELSEKLDWRQDFQASGMHFQNKKSDYYKLLDWVKAPAVLLKHWKIYTAATIVFSALTVFSLYLFLDKLFSASFSSSNWCFYVFPVVITSTVNYLIIRKLKPTADEIVKTSQRQY